MRRFAALVSTGLVAIAVLLPVVSAAPATAAASGNELTVTVSDMDPWTPTPSKSERPLAITVTLHNQTGSDLPHVVLRGARGTPVTTQSALDSTLSTHTVPSGLLSIPARPTAKSDIDVPAGATVSATFRTTTTTSSPYKGLCLCANAVYPVYVLAEDSGSGTVLGSVRTYLTSVDNQPDSHGNTFHKLDVAWVWPLIDTPHRTTDAHVFTDRSLVTELGPTGRLARALQVADDVGRIRPITLVIDPDLIDELAILSSGNYSYRSVTGATTSGTKVAAATTWLATLRQVLAYSDVRAEFTPYADPDVQSLSAQGLTWHPQLPPTMNARVEHALHVSTLPSTVAWPAGGAATRSTLTQLAADGADTVLLDRAAVRPSNVDGLPASAATLHTGSGTISAALTSSAAQDDVEAAVGDSSANLSHLPALLAQLAVRTTTEQYTTRSAFLVAPRYVDPDVAAADTVIERTTSSAFSTPADVPGALDVGLRHAVPTRTRPLSSSVATLSPGILSSVEDLTNDLPALRALVTGQQQSSSTAPLLADLGRGLQRAESSAYLSTSTVSTPAVGAARAGAVRRQVAGLLRGVYIVRPESGKRSYAYTLASTNSPLPITVDNTLPYRVFVHIVVSTVGGLPGLTTSDLGVRAVAADSKQTFRVPAHVQRSGRIALVATLTTPGGGHILGPRVGLAVHSTVVGTIGVVITVVAAIVLVLALAVRYVRRLVRLRRKRRASADDPRVPARIG